MIKPIVQTLEDIARLANVSKSTVSRALNNSPLLNQETKERIQAIAREHNFRINASARNLRMQQSRTVAFVAPDYYPGFSSGEDLFGQELMIGIGKGLLSLGYDLLVVHVDPRDTAWVHDYLDSGRVDGFILMTSNLKPSLIKFLVEISAPFIGWGVPVSNLNYCSVSGDNTSGGMLATQHLIRIDRERVAFLGGPGDALTVQHRFSGYEHALQASGRSVDPNLVAYSDYSYASGMAAMQRLLEQSPDLDAVFVNSDLMAIGAIHVIQEGGKRVPEDIAVVGYDDLPIAVYNNLPLTTIRQNIPLAGKLLAQNLIQYIQTGVVTNVTLPVQLVVRASA
ncbi:MAG: LacI family transcriptional regulator [Anaerolineales bacterium]|jgi:DNA-binding LacI/PurR family transcriptional regulator|nr:LacI family transcriptional regulator [Anaerolineales bacterium]